jgi:hypothetical protein
MLPLELCHHFAGALGRDRRRDHEERRTHLGLGLAKADTDG